MTTEERLIAHWEYKIAEHRRNAADQILQAETFEKVKRFTEQVIEEAKQQKARAEKLNGTSNE